MGLGTITCGRRGLVRSDFQGKSSFLEKQVIRTVVVTSTVTDTVVVDASVVKTIAGDSLQAYH